VVLLPQCLGENEDRLQERQKKHSFGSYGPAAKIDQVCSDYQAGRNGCQENRNTLSRGYR